MSKIKIGVLGSTKGTDLQAVIDAIENGDLDAEIALVLSNKEDAFILERARKHNLPVKFVNPKDFSSKDEFDHALREELDGANVDLVLLIGYMKIVGKELCEAYRNKIMNIHPSLLPKYSGGMDTNVHEEVLKNQDEETGCTLHFVTEEVDEGPIIMQQEVKVEENDTVDSLKDKVQKAEQELIIKAIKLFSEGKINVKDGKVIVDG
ncbi:MAG: phosphoribosylglycinamide formyltransferase [Candidatus Diapherotrites archaeon]